jgi:hypothetical protein
MTQIDKNIPIPAPVGGYNRLPYDQLEVGDSFFVEAKDEAVRQTRIRHQKRLGRKFTQRKEGTGYRVWRTL